MPSETFPEQQSGIPDPAGLLRELIRFDTSNPPGNERGCLEFIADLLDRGGVASQLLAKDEDRPNLVARVTGGTSAPPLLLYGHVDVVPADAREWTHPPFAADLSDGQIWGRGALDMKGGVAILVVSLLRVANRVRAPDADLILALTSDEEQGSVFGAKYLVEEHADVFDRVRYAFSEFGGVTVWLGNRRLYPIQVAEKQRCLIRATVRGVGGHASNVVRRTAVSNLGELLRLLDKKRLPVHVTPRVRAMLDAVSGSLPLHQRLPLHGLAWAPLTDSLLKLMGSEGATFDALLHNSATPTLFHRGESSNVLPTELMLDLDGRVLPGQTPADLVRELEGLAGDVATFNLIGAEPAAAADPDLTLYPLLSEIIRRRDPGGIPLPAVVPGYTDARCFAQLGIQTYGFLPMRLPRQISMELMHSPNERVPGDALRFGVDCLTEAIDRYPQRFQ
jgi:acetylornithine deacetylase/succinyl-diaminopimelate desuccinylase-like protein